MWEGNNGNTVQADEKEIGTDVFGDNRRLILLAQSGGDGAEAAEESLVRNNCGLVRSIALRFRDRGVELEDLMQIGTLGLLKAIRSFDLDRGTCFSTYAVPLIFGELRRYMRDEGPIKVGRYYKKLGAAIANEKNRIIAEEGREPTIGELAALCGTNAEEAAVALEAMSPIVSLSDSAYGEEDGAEMLSVIPDEESLLENERICDRIAIGEAMDRMSLQWRQIVIFRYYRGYTQQQTAELLGLTQVKVSREEKKIIAAFREFFI